MIFNIQRYSLHDGNGIRTLVFFKGCPLRCEWCSNPESQNTKPELVFTSDKCIGCGKCLEVCPTGARKNNGKDCILCGKCAEVCPTEALELIGKQMSVSQIIREVEKDRKFYQTSSGGVTLSGGEPLMQWKFAVELIREFKKKYIHVVVETCGYAQWEHFEVIADLADLILYDIKHMDSEVHKKYTGVGNELILENAIKIARKKRNIILRIPLLEGVNVDEENIYAVANFADELDINEIHLLPYHRYGESKYKKLNREYRCLVSTPDDERIAELKEIIESKGISVKISG